MIWWLVGLLVTVTSLAGCNAILGLSDYEFEAKLVPEGGWGGADGGAGEGEDATGTPGTGADASVGSGGNSGNGGAAGDDASAGNGGTGGTGGSGGGGPCGASTCDSLEECWNNTLCVAKLVSIPGGYRIDATEVTRSQYEAWLATGPSTAGQDSWCSFNTDYHVSSTCKPDWACEGSGCGKHPQVCVDWCDAYAYCKAVGKRLCGALGGGHNDFSDVADAASSQWYRACSSGDLHNYSYGGDPGTGGTDGYDGQKCNGNDHVVSGCANGTCGTVETGSLGDCQSSVGGYEGVYDLTGNVWEWEDSCEQYAEDSNICHLRGGSFVDDSDSLRL